MFQRFASLFFGESPPSAGPEEPPAFVAEEDELDGWLIVDLQASSPPPPSPPSEALCPCRGPVLAPAPCLMDESWWVTPPACFTAEGPPPARLASSPLEDLLIEHPSMSVYVTGNTVVLGPDPPGGLQSCCGGSDGEGEVAPSPRPPRPPRPRPPSASHPAAPLPPAAALLGKMSQARRLQQARQHQLSPKCVQRQNRARECRPRRPKHRGSFVHQPCQRQYNY
ncbi:LOW QUALITY PROTEIN: tumor protein p53-inducible nuclear protein 2 [Tachyglossus aculeatus]|uniref:LOW QUALITY PROTEIN: tumor protein p53-inducible nuclear protein 2 n=1 Tax=Tachyglossus aculeatus TaxID=9261 RepID=UPI0018F3C7FE|nr:LOW QUALITY PROTEIN: tumor protein p53-inducible nuclear protein 2 [Tachyglossus aculeatus]